MSIYAISDLHLSFSNPEKTMELFGDKWADYQEKIRKNWNSTVKDIDTVIIPGDICWALSLEEAIDDFKFLEDLPGKKIILKGNHDYYFSTVTKVKKFLKDNNFKSIDILNNNSFCVEGINICGTRLWSHTEIEQADDKKIFRRELIRLKLSLDSVENKFLPIIVATHFPPFRSEVTDLLSSYNVKKCIYGHLHGDGHYMVKQGIINDIEYIMVSGDYTGFKLIKLN
ncbi:MAG: metallophosphoesterase [Clostridia bacterium]|nr:metallophosphoesterase [Clostridia bacterium]